MCRRAIYTPVFFTALLITAKIWNQPKHLSRDEWTKTTCVCVCVCVCV
jgi:hypothetical protein